MGIKPNTTISTVVVVQNTERSLIQEPKKTGTSHNKHVLVIAKLAAVRLTFSRMGELPV